MYHQKKKEMIIQDEQMKKAEQELDGCTFQPATIANKRPVFSYIEEDERHFHL